MSDSPIYVLSNSSNTVAAVQQDNENKQMKLWTGLRVEGSILNCDFVQNQSLEEVLDELSEQGYSLDTRYTIKDKTLVLDADGNVNKGINPEIWYTVLPFITESMIQEYVKHALSQLRGLDDKFANELVSLAVYQDLSLGKLNGGSDYKDGPLGLLLLFGMRRYFKAVSNERIMLADDDTKMLSERYEDIGPLITKISEYSNHWFLSKSKKDIQKIAVALGCLEAPIDLSEIQTKTVAAFF